MSCQYQAESGELYELAANYFRRERQDHTLQTTALLHEAYLRLIETPKVDWRSRAHFIGLTANVMRRVLVEHARHRNRAKRGVGQCRMTLSAADSSGAGIEAGIEAEVEAVDDALNDLERWDPQKAQIVELRFFGGLSNEEISTELDTSLSTVGREWRKSKAWLYSELVENATSSTLPSSRTSS